jgi:hypothetical protein
VANRRRQLVNATDAVIWLRRTHGVRLSPATIRQWAARGHIGSHSFRRERYDLREVVERARQRGLIGDP